MSESVERTTLSPLTLCLPGSLAKTSASPARVPAYQVKEAACSLKRLEYVGSFNQQSYALRTSQLSLTGDLMPYCGTLPKSGIVCGMALYRHQQWVPPTSVSGGLQWPTPSASTFDQSPEVFDVRRARLKAKGINGNGAGRLIAVEVRRQWPTLLAGDAHCAGPNQHTATLGRSVRRSEGNGRLNPDWLDIVMGFPIGWTCTSGPHHRDHSTVGNHQEQEQGKSTIDNE